MPKRFVPRLRLCVHWSGIRMQTDAILLGTPHAISSTAGANGEPGPVTAGGGLRYTIAGLTVAGGGAVRRGIGHEHVVGSMRVNPRLPACTRSVRWTWAAN